MISATCFSTHDLGAVAAPSALARHPSRPPNSRRSWAASTGAAATGCLRAARFSRSRRRAPSRRYISAVSRCDLGAISPQDFYTDATCSGTSVHTRDANSYATANTMSCLQDEDATSTSFRCRADDKELTAKWCAIPTRSRAPAHRPTRVAHTPIAARLASAPRSCMPPK